MILRSIPSAFFCPVPALPVAAEQEAPEIQLDLFADFTSCHHAKKPKHQSYIVCTVNHPCNAFQYNLGFMDNIVRFSPKINLIFTYDATDYFSTLGKKTIQACRRLDQLGYGHVGDVIHLSEEQLLAFSFMDHGIIEGMKSLLEPFEMGFNTRCPQWKKRMEALHR